MDARQRAARRRQEPQHTATPRAQESRYAAMSGTTSSRTTSAAEPWLPNRATDHEKRLQEKASTDRRSDFDPSSARMSPSRLLKATDGSNLAVQFDGKRMRQVHVDDSGAITPEGEWQPVNLPKLLNWVRRTSAATPAHVAGFAHLGGCLTGDDE